MENDAKTGMFILGLVGALLVISGFCSGMLVGIKTPEKKVLVLKGGAE